MFLSHALRAIQSFLWEWQGKIHGHVLSTSSYHRRRISSNEPPSNGRSVIWSSPVTDVVVRSLRPGGPKRVLRSQRCLYFYISSRHHEHYELSSISLFGRYFCPNLSVGGFFKQLPRAVADGICMKKTLAQMENTPLPPDFRVLE